MKVQPSTCFWWGRRAAFQVYDETKSRLTASGLGCFVDESVYSGVTLRLMASLEQAKKGGEARVCRSLVEPKAEPVALRELRGWCVR